MRRYILDVIAAAVGVILTLLLLLGVWDHLRLSNICRVAPDACNGVVRVPQK